MGPYLTTLLGTAVVFGLCFSAMAVGLLVRGKVMRGGCGSEPGAKGADGGCSVCGKRKINLCEAEDDMGLSAPSAVSTMGRFAKRDQPNSS